MATLEQLLSDLTSGDDARAEAAVPALTLHEQEAIAALKRLLDSPIADQRWWAARALSAFPQLNARELLTEALSDPDPSIRQCAALGLSKQPTELAIQPLIAQLEYEDQLLNRLAADALAAIGAAAIPRLEQAAKHPDARVRIQAVRAMALMEAPEAIGPLFNSIEDASTMVTYWAEEGLDRLGIGMSFFNPG